MPIGDRARRVLNYLAVALIVIGFVNFFWFMAESINRGDALSGKIVDGHYFLGNKTGYTEVDQATWEWSRFHALSVWVTHPLAIAAMAFLNFRRVFPAKMAGTVAADPEIQRARLELVKNSGPLLAKGSMGGWIGSVSMTAPLLQVEVYPKGLIMRARLMAEHVILAAEILSVARRRVWLQNAIEVTHLGAGAASPLRLLVPEDDPVVVAIRKIAAAEQASGLPATAGVESPSGPWPTTSAPVPGLPAPEPAIPGLEPELGFVIELLGLGVGLVLLAMGILWAIPKLGLPGIAWTIAATAILLWNGTRFLRRRGFGASLPGTGPTIVICVVAAALIVGLLTVGTVALSGPPSGRAAVVPQAPAGRQVFLAPMGATTTSALQGLAGFYASRYGLTVTVLPPAPIVPRDSTRNQINAESLVAVLQASYAEASNPNDVVIGVVGEDIYTPARPDWKFSFGIYGDHLAVISTWRMEATSGPFGVIQSSARLRKFVTRYIGFVYYGLPASTDPHSVLFDPVLSLGDLDRMGDDY